MPGGVLGWDGTSDTVELLTQAYWMEIEMVTHFLAVSAHGGGRPVDLALARGIDDEVEHTRALGRRILHLHGDLPGDRVPAEHPAPGRRPDDRAALESVIAAELGAIRHYARIVRATVGVDPDTHRLALGILRDERRHLGLFGRFLRECPPAALTA